MNTTLSNLQDQRTQLETELRDIEQRKQQNSCELERISGEVLTRPKAAQEAATLRETGFALANKVESLKEQLTAKENEISTQKASDEAAALLVAKQKAGEEIDTAVTKEVAVFCDFLEYAHKVSASMMALESTVNRNLNFTGERSRSIDAAQLFYKGLPLISSNQRHFLIALRALAGDFGPRGIDQGADNTPLPSAIF